MQNYVIKKGDNLSVIAKRFGTTVAAIKNANNIANADYIVAGKILKVPGGIGTTVEHTQESPSDAQTRQAHAAARTRELEDVAAMKAKHQNTVPRSVQHTSPSNTNILVCDEMKLKKAPPEGGKRTYVVKGKKLVKNFGSVEYWTEKIDRISAQFDFPREIMIAKVSREVTFERNKVSGDQHGCMQIRPTAVRAMFPGAPGNWYDKYKELDEKLLNDILYKKDAKGNYLKDSKGNMIPKYSSWEELHEACKDDEVSLKVGILYDKMQLAESLTAAKYGSKRVYPHVSETIARLKAKTSVTPEENLSYIKMMETRYNGSPSYGKAIADSMIRMGFDLRIPIIKRT